MPVSESELTKRIARLSPSKRALLESKLNKAHEDLPREQSILRRSNPSLAPLSFAQQRLWFLYQMDPTSCAYNNPRAIRLTGALEIESLRRALEAIVARHDVLRTTFMTMDDSPLQVVAEDVPSMMPVRDLSGLPPQERESEARRLAQEDAESPFDLAAGPLLRARLLRLEEDQHVLLLNLHHIVTDGWSMGVLNRELAALYEAFSAGKPSPLHELPIQYGDYAAWQRERLRGEVLTGHANYWKERLGTAPPLLRLPTDKPRPAVQTRRGGHEAISVPTEVSERLHALARQEGVTLFMTLLAAFQILICDYTRQEDVVVGTDVANRNPVETEGLIGFFINNVVLRTDLSGDPAFSELLARVREVALGAYAHEEMPFEKVVEALNPKRSLGHTPLFQVLFTLQNMPVHTLELPGLAVSSMDVGNRTAKYDLTLFFHETHQGLRGSLNYNADLFGAATIRNMTAELTLLLETVSSTPGARLSELYEALAQAETTRRSIESGERKRANLDRLQRIKPKAVRLAR